MAEQNRSRRIVLPPALGSYVTIFTPRASEEGKEPKFSISLLWDKEKDGSTPKALAALEKAVMEAAIQKFGPNAPKLMAAGKLKNPLRDGDIDRPDDKVYANKVFCTASAKKDRQPGIVNAKLEPVFEEAEAYSGCIFRASVNVFPYDKAGNKGVAFGLNNLQVVRKGDRIDGRKDAASEFSDFAEAGEAGADDLADIA